MRIKDRTIPFEILRVNRDDTYKSGIILEIYIVTVEYCEHTDYITRVYEPNVLIMHTILQHDTWSQRNSLNIY